MSRSLLVLGISVLIVFIVSCNNLLISQNVLSGKIRFENGSEVDLANIKLLDKNGAVYGIEHSDSTGRYRIYKDTSLTYIEISYLGYQSIQVYADSMSTLEDNTFYLRPSAHHVQEVEITADRIRKETKGDTTTYNLAHYKSPTDYSFGHVLNKLEGVTVTPQGTILYQNKPIDKILLEGRDILNDQHKLVIEGLAPKDIAKIQILEQYRPFHEQFIKRFSDKVAMNIMLTEEAKQKVNGDMSVGGGVDKKYETRSNLYTTKQNSGISGFVRSNNLGDQTITMNDFMNLQSSLIRTLNNTQGNLESIVPTTLLDKEALQKDWDNLIAANFEKDISPDKTLKISNLSNYTERSGMSEISRVFFQEATPLFGQEILSDQLLYSSAVVNYQNKISGSTLLEIDMPVGYENQHVDHSFAGDELSTLPKSQVLQSTVGFDVFPQVFFSQKINEHKTLKVESAIYVDDLRRDIHLAAEENLFSTEGKSVSQELRKSRKTYSLRGEYVYSKNKVKYGLAARIDYDEFRIGNTISENITPNKKNNSRSLSASPTAWFGYKSDKILIEPKVDILLIQARSTNFEASDVFVNPSISAKYHFSRFNYLLLRGNLNTSLYALESYFDLLEIVDNTTVRDYRIEASSDRQTSKTISLSYLDLNLGTRSRFQSILSYSHITDGLLEVNNLEQNFFYRRKIVADYSSTFSWMTSAERRLLSDKLILRPQATVEIVKFHPKNPITLRSCKTKVTALTNSEKGLNGNLGVSYNFHSQSFNNVKSDFRLMEIEHGIDIARTRTMLKLSGNLIFRSGQSDNTYFYILNFKLNHSLNSEWKIYLAGRDVFNIDSKIVRNYQSSESYIQNTSFHRFPGSIVAGIKRML